MANILLYSLDTTSISNGKDILVVFVIRKIPGYTYSNILYTNPHFELS